MIERVRIVCVVVFGLAAATCSESTAPEMDSGSLVGVWAGVDHTCVLDDQGRAYCWGSNHAGESGSAAEDVSCIGGVCCAGCRRTVTQAHADYRFSGLVLGLNRTCGTELTRGLVCWGREVQDPSVSDACPPDSSVTYACSHTPVVIDGGSYGSGSANLSHACVLDLQGGAQCWGANHFGQLGTGAPDGSVPRTYSLSSVVGGHRFESIAAGWSHTCAADSDDIVWCWGHDGAHALGDGDTVRTAESRAAPAPVAGDARFEQVVAGNLHTCALTAAGQAYCWGSIAPPFISRRPQLVEGQPEPFETLTAGRDFVCALGSSKRAYCWGSGNGGRLGRGEGQGMAVLPVPVAGGHLFRTISAGSGHACGLTITDEVWCWGSNFWGQLGVLSGPEFVLEPTRVLGLPETP